MCSLHADHAGPHYWTTGTKKMPRTLAHRIESAFDEPFFNVGQKDHAPHALEFDDGYLFAIMVASQKEYHARARPLPPRGNATPVRPFQ